MNEWKTKWQEFWQQGQDFLARIRKGVRCGETPAEPSANEETSSQPEGTEASLGDRCVAFFREMSWKKGLVAAILVILLAGGISCLYLFGGSPSAKRASFDADQSIYVMVKPGMNANDIAAELVDLGVIDSKMRFWWLTRVHGYGSQIKTGTYAFQANMDEETVLQKLVAGDTTVIRFTIPEGFSVREIAKRLADAGLVDEQEFLAQAKDFAPYPYMKKQPHVQFAAEGFLFPDTYELHGDAATPEGIMKMMAEDFEQRLTPEMRQQAAAMNLSIHDLITLASLVEKEARYDEDRPIIAQVFFKRLSLGMPLQSDTTLQYLMAAPKEDVSIEDTKIDSPYNTYQVTGLPPGPIANPGLKSIEAVLHPAATDYLYFVADRQGHNHYSTNYADHEAIVEQVR
ncbi:endolytic transglycosylase MltG [Mitsuokella sp.]|uniref:endolytic transglycosylase MltG n=1 Tax=Mitsuokella sp. TaxID=2049034 RepID=UPI002A834D3D|nr:endolytic transglycosylase MltG [Mitsuokella sp.]MDY4475268.1 endolytic transglycosylase MltG [Mitsuokella sp.]